ncbi:hypothetical protein ABZ612_41705 [Streptomyces avermitilis]|uniref:hypothetical protein n=1 Tax=Streptomyces avermitilis TaxID=33903 RepID=UPI0033FED4B6
MERERLALKEALGRGHPSDGVDYRRFAPLNEFSDGEILLALADLGDLHALAILDSDLFENSPLPDWVVSAMRREYRDAGDAAARVASAAEWHELWERAGSPHARTIAGYAGLSISTVEAVLSAHVDPVERREAVEKVFAVLHGR